MDNEAGPFKCKISGVLLESKGYFSTVNVLSTTTFRSIHPVIILSMRSTSFSAQLHLPTRVCNIHTLGKVCFEDRNLSYKKYISALWEDRQRAKRKASRRRKTTAQTEVSFSSGSTFC